MTKPKTASELNGLVYGVTVIPSMGTVPLYERPLFWAGDVVVVVLVVLNIIFW